LDRVSEAAAEVEVKDEGDDVGEGFEEEVRMNGVRAGVKVDGERWGEMGGEDDGELYRAGNPTSPKLREKWGIHFLSFIRCY